MSELPLEVADQECIVRVVIHSWLKGDKLSREAYKPKRGKSGDISVIRHDYMGSKFCKQHGKNKVQKLESPNSRIYVGLAATKAATFRALGGDVKDTRLHFLGHADADIGMTRPNGGKEPDDPDELLKLNRHLDRIVDRTKFFLDPDPTQDDWTGDDVRPAN